jgi:CRISPR system Cascade subunit CasD
MVLKLTLAAPLQAWGGNAPWGLRQTDSFPTKSGLMGLCGRCLGLDRDSYPALANGLRVAFIRDRPGTIEIDFQTVDVLPQTRVANGGWKRSRGLLLVTKEYLADARFIALIEGPEDQLRRLYNGLAQPHWPPYLGRACCLPSEPLVGSLDEALLPGTLEDHLQGDVEVELRPGQTAPLILDRPDEPLGRSQMQAFGVRRVGRDANK